MHCYMAKCKKTSSYHKTEGKDDLWSEGQALQTGGNIVSGVQAMLNFYTCTVGCTGASCTLVFCSNAVEGKEALLEKY